MVIIDRLCISGYRSLRDVRIALGPLTVVTGANGSGKSSLYRALRLLADIAQGRIIQSLAAEGGFGSVLWAGPEIFSRDVLAGRRPVQGTVRRRPVSLRLGFSSDDYGYAIDLGLPAPGAIFLGDAEIKAESLWTGPIMGRANVFAERRGPAVRIRDERGAWRLQSRDLAAFDSMMTHCNNPHEAIELLSLREDMRGWRFYDYFRTDSAAPARRRQVGTFTPVLASDGADLAAALRTIIGIGNPDALGAVVTDAFPGAHLDVVHSDGYHEVVMDQHGLLRPLTISELSDGTLRYLLLIAALLTPRPPAVMVLNEPETSLHPDLLAPLARLIARSSRVAQIVVVSHAPALVTALTASGGRQISLEKRLGETVVQDDDALTWTWPSR